MTPQMSLFIYIIQVKTNFAIWICISFYLIVLII